MPTCDQEPRVNEPMVQNTNCCNSVSDEIDCRNVTSALNANTNAMPNKITVPVPASRSRVRNCSNNNDPNANTNALIDTIQSWPMPGKVMPSTMASAAPKDAA